MKEVATKLVQRDHSAMIAYMGELMNTHTPGPWEWQRGERYWKLHQKEAPHEAVLPKIDLAPASSPVMLKMNQANAQLIAAAPELLEALKEMMERWDNRGSLTQPMERARVIIAKAEGGVK